MPAPYSALPPHTFVTCQHGACHCAAAGDNSGMHTRPDNPTERLRADPSLYDIAPDLLDWVLAEATKRLSDEATEGGGERLGERLRDREKERCGHDVSPSLSLSISIFPRVPRLDLQAVSSRTPARVALRVNPWHPRNTPPDRRSPIPDRFFPDACSGTACKTSRGTRREAAAHRRAFHPIPDACSSITHAWRGSRPRRTGSRRGVCRPAGWRSASCTSRSGKSG